MDNPGLQHTPLYKKHLEEGAHMVNFAGYEMPLHYGSQLEEHLRVRNDAGIFDVSHMGIIDINGVDAKDFLKILLANNIEKLKTPGTALYSCMLNEQGGVIDDLIAYYLALNQYRLVVNAGTKEKDLTGIQHLAKDFSVEVLPRVDLGIIAIQGPRAKEKTGKAYPQFKNEIDALAPFHFFQKQGFLIANTGYTGEDGLEVILPQEQSLAFWEAVRSEGVFPIGLGARDTLRLEAGLNLYGQDMDESTTPLESHLAWTLAFEPKDRQFIGRQALELQKERGVKRKLVGLILEDKGIMRSHQTLLLGNQPVGEVTSGTYSPTLKQSIGFARIDLEKTQGCQGLMVDIRGKHCPAKIVQPPFLRFAKRR